MTAVKSETEIIEDCAYGDDCPLHTENPPFNAKVLAAVAENRVIMRGDIPVKKYNSLEEAQKDLGVQPGCLTFTLLINSKKTSSC